MTSDTRRTMVPLIEAGALLGLHRTATYNAARTGHLATGVRVLRVGRRSLAVPVTDLERALGRPLDADQRP